MAKAKDDTSAEVGEDSSAAVAALTAQVDQLTRVVRAAVERIEAVEAQNASLLAAAGAGGGGTRKCGSSDSLLATAATIGGAIAAQSSSNGLLTGAHEHTVALSAIRLAASIHRVGGIVQDKPQLLFGRIGQAYAELESTLQEQDANRGGNASGQ